MFVLREGLEGVGIRVLLEFFKGWELYKRNDFFREVEY